MTKNYSKNNVISSLFWKLLERGGTQGIQLITQVVLARLLAPQEFGTLALLLVFINLAQVFVQNGFSGALIQKKDADELDFSSVFYVSLVIAGILYIFMYISAPLIANFYENSNLSSIIRVLSLTLFPGALNSIQNAYISRNLLFKKLFKSSLGSIIISGLLGIVVAYLGFGVWALVVQQLANQYLIAIILWYTVKWRPKRIFSIVRIKKLFSYGSKLLASSLLDTLYLESRTLIIGRIYMPATLGFYNRGEQFPKVIVNNVNGSIQSVMLPAFAAYQEDKRKVKSMMRRAIVTSSFLIFPMMIGMAVMAETLVTIILTEKWLPAVPFLQIFCISYALVPLHTANLQAINALGRSDIFLRLEITKKLLGFIILLISLPLGVYAIALGQILSGLMSSFINAYPNKSLLNYGYKEQVQDVSSSLMLSLIMGAAIYFFKFFNLTPAYLLIIQILVGGTIYLGLAWLFKVESFKYLFDTLRILIKTKIKVK